MSLPLALLVRQVWGLRPDDHVSTFVTPGRWAMGVSVYRAEFGPWHLIVPRGLALTGETGEYLKTHKPT
jgi:hypothetical protein